MLSESAIRARFRRAKLNAKHTFLWEEAPDAIRQQVDFIFGSHAKGKGDYLIVYYKSEKYFWTIFSTSLLVFNGSEVLIVPFSLLKKVDFLKFNSPTEKLAIETLTLTWDNTNELTIYVENTIWPFIYSLFLFFKNK